jgi:glycosyltransferase involved in cell wall biosynthesis
MTKVLPEISVVIPVYNGGIAFEACLKSLASHLVSSREVITEVIVVADGCTDGSDHLAETFGATVLRTASPNGPARARNLGASQAQGNILFFIDADVTIHDETLAQVVDVLARKPNLAAAIGSYDDAPGAVNFLSQYKNLLHHYTHQTSSSEASTFWGACGAIRRDIFLEVGGFDENYRHPSVEDIDLGYRLKKAGYQIELCKAMQVKHLKCWKPISLLKAEFFYRALPWTELIWRDRQFVNDLNLKFSSRISLLLAYGILATFLAAFFWMGSITISVGFGLFFLAINLPVYRFFRQKRGLLFASQTVFWHWLYFLYGGLAFAIGTLLYHWPHHRSNVTPKLLGTAEP